MNKAKEIIKNTFEKAFDFDRFQYFTGNLLNEVEKASTDLVPNQQIKESYQPYINYYRRIWKYKDPSGKIIDVIAVFLKKESTFEARTFQRNFVLDYLKKREKDAVLAAFIHPDQSDWRFSFVKLEFDIKRDPKTGKIKDIEKATSAKRYSYLVGENENSHTAQSQLVKLLEDDENNPTLEEIEQSFGVETVTKEFFTKYRELFHEVEENLKKVLEADQRVQKDFADKDIDTVDFAKKLLGQIVFLYFLQKKGWFGVERDKAWGTGSKTFLRDLFERKLTDYNNFFNDILELLFFEALARERDDNFYGKFNCKIPFLNGGLFDPLNNYDWVHTDIKLPNDLFSNSKETKEGDIGDGILDVFDRYNFTVKEDEPLEKEVAIDPEMLGKVFENMLEVKDRKSKGTYYTPREIVHYMCQESLINYLATELEGVVSKKPLEYLVKEAEGFLQHEQARTSGSNYDQKMPDEVIEHASEIDKKLSEIKVCDPAIGSGAFPVGMMNEIVKARSLLTTYLKDKKERSSYDFKRHAIANSLYGVDIDPSAVEIAKLRLWLSLIVDETDIRNIKPLPNLDYKIMQGNSLLEEYEGIKLFDESLIADKESKQQDIERFKEEQSKLQKEYIQLHSANKLTQIEKTRIDSRLKDIAKQLKSLNGEDSSKSVNMDLFQTRNIAKEKADKLLLLQKDYFKASQKSEKDSIKKEIDELIWDLIEATVKQEGKENKLKEIEKFKKTNTRPFFLWHLNFAEVFQDNKGFDVVIANPPYIGDKNHKDIFRPILKTSFGEKYYVGQMDIFYFFFHHAINITNEFGQIAFISTNYYLTATSAKKLRKEFKDKTTVRNLINFNELKIFESALGQHNMITILSKPKENGIKALNCITKRTGIAVQGTLKGIIERIDDETEYFNVKQEDLYESSESYIRIQGISNDNPINVILNKMKQVGAELGNDKICFINAGIGVTVSKINSGYIRRYPHLKIRLNDGVFVVKPGEFKDLELEKVKDFVKNSDISHYHYKLNSDKLIYLRWEDDIDKYPAIRDHLLKFKKILDDQVRAYEECYPWFALNRPRETEMFESKVKIISPYRAKRNYFAFADAPLYGSRDVFYIRQRNREIDLKYILALLNTRLYYLWLYYRGKRKGETLELYQKPLSEIPIRMISNEEQKPFVEIVDKILAIVKQDDYLSNRVRKAEVKRYEKVIDKMVYKLYGLTEEEIKIVEEEEQER